MLARRLVAEEERLRHVVLWPRKHHEHNKAQEPTQCHRPADEVAVLIMQLRHQPRAARLPRIVPPRVAPVYPPYVIRFVVSFVSTSLQRMHENEGNGGREGGMGGVDWVLRYQDTQSAGVGVEGLGFGPR